MEFSGNKLKTIRGNIKAEKFINQSGLNLKSRLTLFHWEAGVSEPKATQLFKIANFTKKPMEYFFE